MMDYSQVDYTLVPCPFCGVGEFQDCVKVRGKNKGQPAEWFHTVRGYAYWDVARRRPLR